MPEIFKIQLPLETNDLVPKALVYNQDKSIAFVAPAKFVKPIFAEGEDKIFVLAEFGKDGWCVIKKIQWQDW